MFLIAGLFAVLPVGLKLILDGLTLTSLEQVMPNVLMLALVAVVCISIRRQFAWFSLVHKLSGQLTDEEDPHK